MSNSQKFCEHIQRGEGRPYQRLEIGGVDMYHCWKCAENINPILSKVDDLWGKLNQIVNKDQSATTPPLWKTSIN